MIRQRDYIHQWFIVRMSFSYYGDRFVHQLALAIDFDLIFRRFADLFNFSFKGIGTRQRSVISLYGVHSNAVVKVPNPPDTDLRQFVPEFQSIFPGNENLKLYFCKIFHYSCFLIFFPSPALAKMVPSSKAVLPRNTTFLTLPFTVQPSNGVQPQRVSCSEALISYSARSSTSTQVSGCSGIWKIFRGLMIDFSTIWSMVNRPSPTAVSNNGSNVSRPGKPGGGLSESFSSIVCGA